MLHVDHEKWGQTVEDLRRLAVESKHPRTRERFQAVFEIARGREGSAGQKPNATAWAARTGRHDDTVQAWVHAYNARGPEALTYRRTGGVLPFFRKSRKVWETSCAVP
jgi:hypothetical protein